MNDSCPVCEDPGELYYEGYDYPEWKDQKYSERDLPVGKFFCSIDHMIDWLVDQGFEISADFSNKGGDKI